MTNLPFSWLPRIGLSGMDCKPAGQRSTRNKYAAHGIYIINDICISQLCFDLLVTPTVGKKLQTNVMLPYKLFASCVFLNSAYLLSKYIYIYIYFFFLILLFSVTTLSSNREQFNLAMDIQHIYTNIKTVS